MEWSCARRYLARPVALVSAAQRNDYLAFPEPLPTVGERISYTQSRVRFIITLSKNEDLRFAVCNVPFHLIYINLAHYLPIFSYKLVVAIHVDVHDVFRDCLDENQH